MKPTMQLPTMVQNASANGGNPGNFKANRWTLKAEGKEITAFHAVAKISAADALLYGVPEGSSLKVSIGVPLKLLNGRPDRDALVSMAHANHKAIETYRATQTRGPAIPDDVMAEAQKIIAARAAGTLNKGK